MSEFEHEQRRQQVRGMRPSPMRCFDVIFLTNVIGRRIVCRHALPVEPGQTGDSFVSRFFFVFLCFFACACVSSPHAVATTASDYVYKLGRGDKVKISVFGEEQLTGDYAVNGNGEIAFPLLGPIKADGRTAEELRVELQSRLGQEYIRAPRVTIDIANYRPVFILGEVAQPGEFAYAEGLTVFALVAKAGGFTYRANQTRAYIRHESARDETFYVLESATAVRPGDTIRIGQRIF